LPVRAPALISNQKSGCPDRLPTPRKRTF
jgi:hypothetical protein